MVTSAGSAVVLASGGAHAEPPCPPGQFVHHGSDINGDGVLTIDEVMCAPEGPPLTPAPTSPPATSPPATEPPPATTPPVANPPATDPPGGGGSGGDASSGGADDPGDGGESAPAAVDPFEASLAEVCAGDEGQPVLADALDEANGGTGSERLGTILRTCDVEFSGDVDEALGRPRTNVELMIADPANNVTPNDEQTLLLNRELQIYWRIAESYTP